MFFCRLLIFSKSTFLKNSYSVTSSLDLDQAWHFVRPDLGPNCLQRLSELVGKELRLIWQQPCKSSLKKVALLCKKVNCNLCWLFVWTVNFDTNESFTCQWHLLFSAMHRSKGGRRGQGVLILYFLENHKAMEFLSNTGPDPVENQKATKPAFNGGPSSARQRNTIQMAFCWRANDGPLLQGG